MSVSVALFVCLSVCECVSVCLSASISPKLLSLLSVLTNTLPGPSASEVTTLWRYTNLFIIITVSYTHLTLPTILRV